MEEHIEIRAKEKKLQAIEFAFILECIDFQIEDKVIYLSPLMNKKTIKKVLKKYDFNLKKIDIDVIKPDFNNISQMKNIDSLSNKKKVSLQNE